MPLNQKLHPGVAPVSPILTGQQKKSALIERFFRSRLRMSQLRVLAALADLGQQKKVADAMNVTPSAISKQLREIEDAIQTQLFERMGHQLRLTDVGDLLARRACEMLEQLERTRIELDQLCAGMGGSIGVGAAPTVAPVFLPSLVVELKGRAPNAFFRFEEGRYDRLGPMLADAVLDVLIARELPQSMAQEFTLEEILHDPIVLVCGEQHVLAGRSQLDWKDLKGVPWILPSQRATTYAPLESLMARHDIRLPPGCMESISLDVNIELLEAHSFVALFPLSYVHRHAALNRVKVLPLDTGMRGSVKAVWRRDNPNPMLGVLLESIRKRATALCRRPGEVPMLPRR